MKIFIRGAAAALALSLVGVSGAEAQIDFDNPIDPNCSVGSGFWTPSFTECRGAFAGNNTGSPANRQLVWDYIEGTWGFTDVYEADGVENFTGTEGTITFNNLYSNFVLGLKQGDAFSLFWFDGSYGSLNEVEYSTAGVQVGADDDLSHWTLYAGRETSVPEPGTMLLLGTGLLGMAFARRRENEIEA